jgi:uncharacterized lipoprotein YddW (UPF0748 family)
MRALIAEVLHYACMVFMALAAWCLLPDRCAGQPSPKYEMRAAWVATIGGIDWPPRTRDAEEQRRALIAILDDLHEKKFNAVFFQVRTKGTVFYRSQYEPWASELSGTVGRDPGWDPLAVAVAEAHKRGMELHAWWNAAKISGKENGSGAAPASRIVPTHPEWAHLFDGEWWLDWGNPQARADLTVCAMEVALGYDIDGIQFDYLRYPGPGIDDADLFRRYGSGMERDEWRRSNITAFVRDFYRTLQKEKPRVKVGSTPIGIYTSIPGAQSSFNGFDGVYQDSRRWLREKIHDYVAPQIYWDIGEQRTPNDPDFAALCLDWVRERYGRQVYIGMGAYRDNVRNELAAEIAMTRRLHADGQTYFRYRHIADFPFESSVYPHPAIVPPMVWKDSVPPLPPENIRTIVDARGTAAVSWQAPAAAADGDLPYRYVVYRSSVQPVATDDANNICAVLPAAVTHYRDDRSGGGAQYAYTVTALDRLNNESTGMTLQQEYERLARRTLTGFALAQNFPDPFTDRTYISYRLGGRCVVELRIRQFPPFNDIVVLRTVQDAGSYVLPIDGKKFLSGKFKYELRAGEFWDRLVMEKK